MPHLSPMNWLSALILFPSILLSLASASWWLQPPTFTYSQPTSHKLMTSMWKW